MIRFHGKVDSEIFEVEKQPGRVDTQKQIGNEPRTLSARYVLEGTDKTGTLYGTIGMREGGVLISIYQNNDAKLYDK